MLLSKLIIFFLVFVAFPIEMICQVRNNVRLKNNHGADEEGKKISEENAVGRGARANLRPPPYLFVPGWKKCLGEKQCGSITIVCLPSTKPDDCNQTSWEQLCDIDMLEKCEDDVHRNFDPNDSK
jgi:hypothetical protein